MIYYPFTDEDYSPSNPNWNGNELEAQGHNKTYHFHWDTNKNITHVTDEKDKIVAHYDYSAFGRIVTSEGDFADSQPFRFSCEYYDSELGLIAYNYRHYNPIDGRFLSRDPIGESGGYNLYGFCNNDPINHTDHLGMKFKPTEESKGKTRRVYVSDQPNGEPKSNLSKEIRLNDNEFNKWAKDVRYSKKNTDNVCEASVPNIGYIDFVRDVGLGTWGLIETNIAITRMKWSFDGVLIKEYRNHGEVNLSLINSQFKSPDIYKFMFAGHGVGGYISLTPSYLESETNPSIFVSAEMIHAHHRISYLLILACNSYKGDWGSLVSQSGGAYTVRGYYPYGFLCAHKWEDWW